MADSGVVFITIVFGPKAHDSRAQAKGLGHRETPKFNPIIGVYLSYAPDEGIGPTLSGFSFGYANVIWTIEIGQSGRAPQKSFFNKLTCRASKGERPRSPAVGCNI